MNELLYVDCLIRGGASRTARIARSFFDALDSAKHHVTHLDLMQEGLRPLVGDFFQEREALLQGGSLDDGRFSYARQFAQADDVVIAAPFWDLSFPALLKIYIENVSVDGITFGCNAEGIYGTCRGHRLIFLTSRGGCYNGSPQEQGSRYLAALKDFFGFDEYRCIAADGLDSEGADVEGILSAACDEAVELARSM